MNLKCLLAILGLLTLPNPATIQAREDFSHTDWDQVLSEYVDKHGLVNYVGLSQNQETFQRYISRVEEIGPRSHPGMFPGRSDKLSFYINAYNALTFEGVLSRGPEEESVWSGPISGYIFFELMDIRVEGHQTTLKSLEDDIIRAGFEDPRIHAAIVCASISCPRLSRVAYRGDVLDQQLDNAMTEFVIQKSNVDFMDNTLYLSSIFDWFEKDFVSYEESQGNTQGSDQKRVIDYINRYRPQSLQLETDIRVSYFDYDKRINKQ